MNLHSPMVKEQHTESDVGIEEAVLQTYEDDVDLEWPIIDRFVEQVRSLYDFFDGFQSGTRKTLPERVEQKNICIFQLTFPPQEEENEPQQHEIRGFDVSSKIRGEAFAIYFFDDKGNAVLADLFMSFDESGQMSTLKCSKLESKDEKCVVKTLTIVEVNISEQKKAIRACVSERMEFHEQPLTDALTILSASCEFLQPFVEIMTSQNNQNADQPENASQ